jgi:hypothetical protein
MFGVPTSAFLICLMAGLGLAMAQTPAPRPPDRQAPAKASSEARPPDPTRDPLVCNQNGLNLLAPASRHTYSRRRGNDRGKRFHGAFGPDGSRCVILASSSALPREFFVDQKAITALEHGRANIAKWLTAINLLLSEYSKLPLAGGYHYSSRAIP